MIERQKEAIILMNGIQDETLVVLGYSSDWLSKGPGNVRKVVLTLQDTRFDVHGVRIKT
jgi:hypothetical protein